MSDEHPLTTKLRSAVDSGDPAKISRVIARIDAELQHPDLWNGDRVAEALGINSRNNIYRIDDLPKAVARGWWSAYEIKNYARKRRADKQPV